MSTKVDDVVVIIRSSSERTEELCKYLVEKQVPETKIVVIKEKPFTAALKRSFEIGLDFGLTWTLCIDADVLISTGAISDLLNQATDQSTDFFNCTGRIYDKFYGRANVGGLHLYRTSLLGKAVSLVPEPGMSLRPETYVKDTMHAQGYPCSKLKAVYGIHDYEQAYCDIFRKMVVRGQKSEEHIKRLLVRAELLADEDIDFLVAIWGIRYGQSISADDILLDSEQWSDLSSHLLITRGLKEKPNLITEEELNIVNFVLLKSDIKGDKLTVQPEFRNGQHFRFTDIATWRTGQYLIDYGTRLQERVIRTVRTKALVG